MDTETPTRSNGLTAEERETLQRALELGYFDVPRAATLTEVAERLGTSDTNVSQQIRGGIRSILRGTDVLATPPATLMTDGSETPRRLDVIFDALGHPYRRRILLMVSDHNPRDEDEFSVDDLKTEDDDLELLTEELYQLHLPKLVDAGYIEWNEDTQTIRRGPNFNDIEPLLRLMHDHRNELPNGWP